MRHAALIAVVMLMNGCNCERRTTVISAKHLDVIHEDSCETKPCPALLTCVPFAGEKQPPTCRLVCDGHNDCPEGFSCARFTEGGPRPGDGRGVCTRNP